jgi:glycerol uptake facilitator protein
MVPRPLLATCVAEVLGTFLLIFFGCGSVHVAILIGDLSGGWQVGIVWGISIMLAIYVFGPISGAHINPAITIGLASWGLFPKNRVLPYVASQVCGAFVAATILFVLFHAYLADKEAARGVERGKPGSEITAMCYGEYFPNPGALASGEGQLEIAELEQLNQKLSTLAACLAEILATAILALVVVSVTEPGNTSGPQNLAPVFIGLTVTGLICVLAPLTQACLNPARDFGPRLFAFFAGWGPIALPGPRGLGFLTVYIISPIVGGILGVGLYQSFLRRYVLFPGEDSDVEID